MTAAAGRPVGFLDGSPDFSFLIGLQHTLT
jgi:hypothetical protein